MVSRPDLAVALMDEALRTLLARPRAARPFPSRSESGTPTLHAGARAESARLMRVNRAGEIAAQALYLGQSLTAGDADTQTQLLTAADEERDHLAWCTQRLQELGGRGSLLDPFWFAGSACLGAAVGLVGDATSLGFIEETEIQVEAHLKDHIERLPAEDSRSRGLLEQMAVEESGHGQAARAAGGTPLPPLARRFMTLGGEILRHFAYRI